MDGDEDLLECIGDGHGGCGWRGAEGEAEEVACRWVADAAGVVTGWKPDAGSEDSVFLCPACGGECSHVPLAEYGT